MKAILKEKKLWLAFACVLLAIACMVLSQFNQKSLGVISQMEKALNQNDQEKYVNCFLPENQEEAEVQFSYMSLDTLYYGNESGVYTYQFIQGDITQLDKDTKSVKVIVVVYDGEKCIEVNDANMNIITVDGKEYIEG